MHPVAQASFYESSASTNLRYQSVIFFCLVIVGSSKWVFKYIEPLEGIYYLVDFQLTLIYTILLCWWCPNKPIYEQSSTLF